jgi:hypothetical protein
LHHHITLHTEEDIQHFFFFPLPHIIFSVWRRRQSRRPYKLSAMSHSPVPSVDYFIYVYCAAAGCDTDANLSVSAPNTKENIPMEPPNAP